MRRILIATLLLLASLAHGAPELPELLDGFYKTYVVEVPSVSYDSLVDYKRLRRDLRQSRQSRQQFSSIEQQIASFEKEGKSKNELVAFYANAYNFLTIKLILDNYRKFLVRLPSIVLIDLNTEGPWKNHYFQVAGERVTLDDIEHRILREELLNFRDGRIHFALNCASRGCPPLLNEAFRAERLETQLNALTRSGLQLPRMVKIREGVASVSMIFDWFLPDFENERGSVAAFIAHYSDQRLLVTEPLKYQKYNWCLNNYLNRRTLSQVLGVDLRLCSLI